MSDQSTGHSLGEASGGRRGSVQPDRLAAQSSVSDWLQTFGALAAVAVAFVTAGTARGRITVALAICAAVAVCVLVRQVATRRPWTGRRRLLVSAQLVAPLVLIVAATVVSSGPDDPRSAQAGNGQPAVAGVDPDPVMTQQGYVLRPSSFIDTNDEDKIDLDTGCPDGATCTRALARHAAANWPT